MAKAGLTPSEVVTAATHNSAQIPGRDQLGMVAPGKPLPLHAIPSVAVFELGVQRCTTGPCDRVALAYVSDGAKPWEVLK